MLQKLHGAIPYFLFLMLFSCAGKRIIPSFPGEGQTSGTALYKSLYNATWQQRDSAILESLLNGNIPQFLRKFVPVRVGLFDTLSKKTIHAVYYVSPDYLSAGSNRDWVRVNLSPAAAQRIADSFSCFLPTRKMVDDIYGAAKLKLEPLPLYAFRDSTPTMLHHHLMVEGQRKGRKGLIAGIKKDIVISGKLLQDAKPGCVAIYGWHQLDGKPIQPLYTGHVYGWVDYSQAVRLIYRKIKVDNKWMDYTEVLAHPVLKNLLCDEEYCDFYKYPY
jgi:hypothetical protein